MNHNHLPEVTPTHPTGSLENGHPAQAALGPAPDLRIEGSTRPLKRVIVLNQFALPRDQGGGTRHADLFSRVHGWVTLIVAGDRNHYTQRQFTAEDPSFLLVPVPPQDGGVRTRLRSWLAYCRGAARVGLRARADVVFASSPHLLAPALGWVLARATGAALVVEIRDLWPESMVAAGLLRPGSATHRMLARLEQFVVRRADEIVAVTSGWEDHFRSLGADMSRYTVVTNGTEPYDLELSEAERAAVRSEFGLTRPTAVFAGAHGPKDGIDLILDAAARRPDIQFLLIGDGPAKFGARSRVVREKLTNVALRDPVAKVDLPRLLAACDIGIHAVSPLPVFQLGISPNKLFDYLAAGLPVVSNAGAGVIRLIGTDDCGHVGESDSLAAGLGVVRAAQDDQLVRWSRAGRRLIEERFSRRQAAQTLTGVLLRADAQRIARRKTAVTLSSAWIRKLLGGAGGWGVAEP